MVIRQSRTGIDENFLKNLEEMGYLYYENISEIIDNERNSIKIQVTLKHGLTGLTKVFSAEYVSTSDIAKGHFAFGNNIKIN